MIESRLHLVPPFRRRLVPVPFGLDQPYWIEDPDFDIEFHVRELALPVARRATPSSPSRSPRLHARPLDRRRPLWELYLIHGLSGGRAAIYTKIHHAAIDGVSGNDILTAVLDLTPEGRPAPRAASRSDAETPPGAAVAARPQRGDPRDAPAAGHPAGDRACPLGARAGAGRGRARWPSGSPAADRAGADVAAPGCARPRRRSTASISAAPALGARRPAARRGQGGQERGTRLTVNDVVMALCAGALRRYLAGPRRAAGRPAGGGRAGVGAHARTSRDAAATGCR